MDCLRAKELLSDYLDGILDTQSATQVEMHLAGCTGCRHQLDTLKALVSELNRLDPVKPPSDFLNQVHGRLEPRSWAQTIIRKLFLPLRIKLPLELATAVAMAILIVSVIGIQNKQRSTQPLPHISVTRSMLEKEPDSPQIPPGEKIAKAPSVSRKRASHKKDPGAQPILLSMVVKPGEALRFQKKLKFQQAPTQPSAGKDAGAADEENRSLGYFSKPERTLQAPAEDSVAPATPGTSLSKDHRQLEEKSRSDMDQTRYRVIQLVQALGGHVLSGRDDQPAPDHRFVTVDIPAGRYSELVGQLRQIAPFKTPPPSPPRDQTLVRVEIQFISPEL